ncbi:MAG TPA: hypothetical protein ENL20_04115 [Candidatus Cloacimonetes bacterium]|nr:hypothetical protein [Candidatus Cloacimonadota bacterium]
MLKKIGRLDNDSIKELDLLIDSIFKLFDKGKKEKAEKELYKIAKTPNYFIREYIGKNLIKYSDQRKILAVAKKMLKHKMYGIRATALFYLYTKYGDDPEKILKLLNSNFETIPWEVESIINDMWKKFPDFMKIHMKEWQSSKNEKKRALSFHGMENIARSDSKYIMEFISRSIDDATMDVQKKITHIMTQVARANPTIAFPYIREWLVTADETRIKTIWVSMKKLANIVKQKNRRDRSVEDFVILTEQTVNDWKNDENENVVNMGERLYRIITYDMNHNR